MALSRPGGWAGELERWLAPFLAALSRQEQRRWAPLYLKGLLLPGERKSIEPMAARVAPGEVQQLHHFVSASPWPTEPLEVELVRAADRLVGGADAVLVVDDTALVKQGAHSVGVQRQYCGELGKKANCQALVSLTLARGEVPVCVGLRLFLPERWAGDTERRRRAGVPGEVAGRPKWRIALDEIDRVLAAGARFGCVLGDAEYGKAAEFRRGLTERGLTWALGIGPTQKVYPVDVTLVPAQRRPTGRPAKHPVPSAPSVEAAKLFAAMPRRAFRSLSWRRGTKGPLKARFAAVRVRVADGPVAARAQHLPGDEAWLVCEERAAGERKVHLANHPADTPLRALATAIKARWACEQMHQQIKNELGLDHFEGRSWRGLHHHALLCQIAFAFLQRLRLGGEIHSPTPRRRPAARAFAARGAAAPRGRAPGPPRTLPHVQPPSAPPLPPMNAGTSRNLPALGPAQPA
jgi:SRSO17 transposase